jgi:hypothetical protein
MERIPIQSSNLASVGYDKTTNTLEVEFTNGNVYQYSGVPIDVYEGLMASNSKGRYLNENIKKAGYSCTRVS